MISALMEIILFDIDKKYKNDKIEIIDYYEINVKVENLNLYLNE